MADFTFDAVNGEGLTILKNLQEGIINTYHHIYRSDTADTKTLFSENWSDGKVPTAKEIEAEKQRQAGLLKAFATPEEKATMKQVEKVTVSKEKKPQAA